MSSAELDRLGGGAAEVFGAFPVRKTKAQKAAFRARLVLLLQQAGWPVQLEESGHLIKTSNVVAGSVENARVVFTAHYDTPARMPFPNMIAPCNLWFNLGYQLLLGLGLALLAGVVAFLVAYLTGVALVGMAASLVVLLGLLWLVLAGPANPSNANDNTSGVLALLEIARTLPEELRGQAALVFFDNEELGLVGSAIFKQRHGNLPGVPLLNFDCVGVGETILMVLPKALRGDAEQKQRLEAAFAPGGGLQTLIVASALAMYPSDQMHFKMGIGVAAAEKLRVAGYTLRHLHTPRDTRLQQENITYLAAGSARFLRAVAGAALGAASQG